MRVAFEPEALEDLDWWMDKDRQTGLKVLQLIRKIQRDRFEGSGRPEPLNGDLSGWWSRRINDEHRLVYKVDVSGKDPFLIVAQCRDHYDDRADARPAARPVARHAVSR
jgi:toxin YoeB